MTPLLLAVAAASAASRLNAFGMSLMDPDNSKASNQLFSPISASGAVMLLLEGSAGDTEAALRKVTHQDDLSAGASRQRMGSLMRSLTEGPDSMVTLAFGVFTPPNMVLGQGFVKDVQSGYDAQIERLKDTGPAGVAQVDDWIAKATKDRIKRLLQSIGPDGIVLANAVTFDGLWTVPFHESRTKPETFHGSDGDRDTPMMHRTGIMVYRDLSDHEEVELPFRGNRFAMRILLPRSKDPGAVLAAISPDLPIQGATRSVELSLPRFTFSTTMDLRPNLSRVGLGSLFERANLGRMAPNGGPTRIGQAIQKAWIEVNEVGAKAAAATAIVSASAIMRPPPSTPFRVDRPFAFVIQDKKSGAILFAGVMHRIP